MTIIRTVHPELSDINNVSMSGVITEIKVFDQETTNFEGVVFTITNTYAIRSMRYKNSGEVSLKSKRYPKISSVETKIDCIAFGFKANEVYSNYKLYDKVVIQGKLTSKPLIKNNIEWFLTKDLYLMVGTIDMLG
jgi:hypothetical protein